MIGLISMMARIHNSTNHRRRERHAEERDHIFKFNDNLTVDFDRMF